jgi:IrrE N-terminal-like domain
MSGSVIEVPARSRLELRQIAELVRSLTRKHLAISSAYFPIVDVVERLLPIIDPNFCLEIMEKDEMSDVHGLTIPSQHVIKLRSDVYDGACEGKGRDRLTVAHELGHYILHDDLSFPRQTERSEIPAYRSSEWQANCFSGELLVSAKRARICGDAATVADIFGVSYDCAIYQFNVLKKEGLLA